MEKSKATHELIKNEIELITTEEVYAFLNTCNLELKPNQGSLSLPMIQRLYFKMKNNVPFSNICVHEDLIADGHHRYICSEFVIIDDDKSLNDLPRDIKRRLVLTSSMIGLNEESTIKAIQVANMDLELAG
jgi:hypothetical protein